MLDPQWDEAIDPARHRHGPITVFAEAREDLTILVSDGSAPQILPTFWSGACIDRPGGALTYRSAPTPDQLSQLLPPNQDELRPARIDPAPLLEVLGSILDRAQKVVPDASWQVRFVGFTQLVLVGTPEGQVVSDRREGRRVRLVGRLQRGAKTASTAVDVVLGDQLPENNHVSLIVDRDIERLSCRLEALRPDPGETPIVFAPGVGGIWAHELIGHAAEGDTAQHSWLHTGRPRLSTRLTVVDDPRRGRASWKIDDEGVQASATALVTEGIVRGFLHSRTSGRGRHSSTGHGRRGSFREPILPRMGCTFIAAGETSPEEILGRVRNGIYVRRMESAHTEPTSGRAIFRVTDADRICNGRLGHPLQSHLLEASGPETLTHIEFVGTDLVFDTCVGSCHRDGQTIASSVGAPTICAGMMMVRS